MTCIVGIVTSEGVLIAGDSCLSTHYTASVMARPKVFRVETDGTSDVAIGSCGSPRVSQVMQRHLVVPTMPAESDEWDWTVSCLVPALRATLKEHGVQHTEHTVDKIESSSFLLAVNGRLFHVHGDYQVEESACDYAAAGSGREVALGALHALTYLHSEEMYDGRAETAAILAIEAAAEHTPWVRLPVTTITTTNPKKEN